MIVRKSREHQQSTIRAVLGFNRDHNGDEFRQGFGAEQLNPLRPAQVVKLSTLETYKNSKV